MTSGLPFGDRFSATQAVFAGGALAALLGLTLLRARRADRDHPKYKYVFVDGMRLHLLDRGSGPALVLLHGNGAMIQDFLCSGLIDQAVSKYRVLAFDRPGFGRSTRPLPRERTADQQAKMIVAALEQLGVRSAIVLGHSWGTLVAAAMALRAPHLVKGLILVSGFYFPWQRRELTFLSGMMSVSASLPLRFTITPLLGRLFWPLLRRILFSPAPVPSAFRRFPIEIALRPSQLKSTAAETALLIPITKALADLYIHIRQPVTILAGEGDALVGTRHAAALQDELPNSDLVLIPGSGHMAHHTAPELVFAEIQRLAKRAFSDRGANPTKTEKLGADNSPRQV